MSCACFVQQQQIAEPVKTTLSQKIVGSNESFSVVFSTHENLTGMPDFAPLKGDFDILSNSQGHSTSIINGKMDQEISWTLVLMPKREGKLILPAIAFGSHSSLPEEIEVTAAAVSHSSDPLFVETDVQPKTDVYEQTQLFYTIKLYCSVNLAQGTLSDVKVNDPDAIIEKIGNDAEYDHYHTNGKRYRVIERKYAVFPQKAGELVFSPILFEGRILRGGNSFFSAHTPITRVKSGEEKVVVKPVPSPFQKNNWFAANDVIIKGEWSADPSRMALGEPVTWTLTLMADGCLGSQIPEVPLRLPAELRSYPDKPEISNQPKPDGLIGVKQLKVVLIPSKTGEMKIPEISVKWWDLKGDQIRVAKLPETLIQVNDGLVAMNDSPMPEAVVPAPKIEEKSVDSRPLPEWVWGAVGLNVLLIAAIAFLLRKKRKPDPLNQIRKDLKQACAAGDAKQAETALLTWAGILKPEEKYWNLLKIKQAVPESFQQALDELYGALYSQKSGWKGEALWKAFAAFKKQKPSHADKKSEMLKELYPTKT